MRVTLRIGSIENESGELLLLSPAAAAPQPLPPVRSSLQLLAMTRAPRRCGDVGAVEHALCCHAAAGGAAAGLDPPPPPRDSDCSWRPGAGALGTQSLGWGLQVARRRAVGW